MSAQAVERGFTLIEALVAIAIIAILSALAYPMYTEYVTRARRADAVKLLTDTHTRQQHFYQDNRTYASSMSSVNLSIVAGMPYSYELLPGPDGTFNSGYAIIARPESGLGDARCGELWIDQDGVRKSTSGEARCWE